MKNILVINRKNTDNLGDIAISISMKKIVESVGYACISEDFSNPIQTRGINTAASATRKKSVFIKIWKRCLGFFRDIPFLYRYVWYFQNKHLFNTLENQQIDAVVIGGGELIQSNLIFPTALYWWTKLTRRHKIGKCILFAVGVTKDWDSSQKKLVCMALKSVDDIYVRDLESQQNMQMIFGREAQLVPDSVFVNPIVSRDKGEYSLYGITDFRRIKKHSSEFEDEESYYERSIKEIKHIEEETSKEVLLFYTTKADLNECRKFNFFCQKRHKVDIKIANISILEDLESYISGALVVASPRMHACILGKLFSANVRPLLISPKMRSFEKLYRDFDNDASISYQKQLIGAMETALNIL